MAQTALPPLTHHQILALVAPFSRSGRYVDLAASDRMARRVAFKPVAHGTVTETLLLDNPSDGRFKLTRVLTVQDGLQARLTAEGSDPAALLARVDAVPLWQQHGSGTGYVLAKSHRLEAGPAGDTLILTEGSALAGRWEEGLLLKLSVSSVRGISGEVQMQPTGEHALDLPEDLLAVVGWDWARLIKRSDGWGSRLRLRGAGAARSRDAEAKLELGARHLAQTLAEPPALFHDKQVAARWRVVMQRAFPLIGAALMLIGAAAVSKLDLAQESLVRMLIFHAPPILMVGFFCMNELPRVEIPPLPQRSRATSWRVARSASA